MAKRSAWRSPERQSTPAPVKRARRMLAALESDDEEEFNGFLNDLVPIPREHSPVPRMATPVPRERSPVPREATPIPNCLTPGPAATEVAEEEADGTRDEMDEEAGEEQGESSDDEEEQNDTDFEEASDFEPESDTEDELAPLAIFSDFARMTQPEREVSNALDNMTHFWGGTPDKFLKKSWHPRERISSKYKRLAFRDWPRSLKVALAYLSRLCDQDEAVELLEEAYEKRGHGPKWLIVSDVKKAIKEAKHVGHEVRQLKTRRPIWTLCGH